MVEVLDFMTHPEPFLYVVLVKSRPTLSLRPVVKAVLRVCLVFIWWVSCPLFERVWLTMQ